MNPRSPAPITSEQPFDRLEALAELRRLGETLDGQAKSGVPEAELDSTLRLMRGVHSRITDELARGFATRS
ncbi:hypothetical protein ABH930_001451 [Kitasatospora sp. GAS204A]|nr:hypothetical protein [Kitasatospora sp. GAS204B]